MGRWSWCDGTKWSKIQGTNDWTKKGSGKNCSYLHIDAWWSIHLKNVSCDWEYYRVCSLPIGVPITSDRQIIFTAENLTTSELIFKWASAPANKEYVDLENKQASVGGFTLKWYFTGPKTEKSSMGPLGNNDNNQKEYEWGKETEKDWNLVALS